VSELVQPGKELEEHRNGIQQAAGNEIKRKNTQNQNQQNSNEKKEKEKKENVQVSQQQQNVNSEEKLKQKNEEMKTRKEIAKHVGFSGPHILVALVIICVALFSTYYAYT